MDANHNFPLPCVEEKECCSDGSSCRGNSVGRGNNWWSGEESKAVNYARMQHPPSPPVRLRDRYEDASFSNFVVEFLKFANKREICIHFFIFGVFYLSK